MPNYDYECKTCGYTFEVFQNMSDPVLKSCPKCGKGVRRLIGGGLGVIFKGSGFYVTDNKKSSSALTGGGKTQDSKPAEKPAAETTTADTKPSKPKPEKGAGKEKLAV